jgi:hypothetical protein
MFCFFDKYFERGVESDIEPDSTLMYQAMKIELGGVIMVKKY